MGTYSFRINCKLAGGRIETEQRELPLRLPPPAVLTRVTLPESRKKTVEWPALLFHHGNFPSEAEAQAAGSAVRTAVMLAGVLLGVGIDVGTDQILSHAFRRANGVPDERLQPDVHGLQVVPDIEPMLFGSIRSGRAVTVVSPGSLEGAVAKNFTPGKPISKKQELAALLYNQSHFHSSDAVRLVVLVSAIEALTDRMASSLAAVTLVDRMVDTMRADQNIEDVEREALINRLRELRQMSISSACRMLVRDYCGEPAATTFRRLYDTRSELLHQGELAAATELADKCRQLDVLVRRVVLGHVGSSDHAAPNC